MTTASARPRINLHPFCPAHQRHLLNVGGYTPTDTWRAFLIIANILAFQWMTAQTSFNERMGSDDAEAMNRVLCEIGCPCCGYPALVEPLSNIVRRGLDWMSGVSQLKVSESDWPLQPSSGAGPA